MKHVAEREGICVKEVKAHHTSQTCPRCGHVGRENWRGYSYFRCAKCNYEADRDRTASLNIAEGATHVADQLRVRFPSGTPPSVDVFGGMKGVEDGIKPPQASSPTDKSVGD
ncbi:MAG: putative transposase DNA-binding domain protein [Candidatus Bathyarchaeota archaeon BA1]|nr:MAG: putative transposase DNA-binding domain protein [Candidatus Bathyarchaeota archaeon BA1]